MFIKKNNTLKIPTLLSAGYIPSLDGIRALAICIVLFAHTNLKLHIPIITKIFGFGTLGVHIFFVISGFLITTLLLKEKIKNNQISLKRFYLRRALRIFPVATLYIIVLVILNWMFKLEIKKESFIYQLTYTENFNLSNNPYTKHFWSLSLEEQFYIIFPFLLRKNLRAYVITALIIIVLSPLITFLTFHSHFHELYLKTSLIYVDIFFNRGLISILIGSLFAIFLFKYTVTLQEKIILVEPIQILNLIIIWLIFNYQLPIGISQIILPIFISFFIFSLIIYRNSLLFKIFNLKIITSIGVLSYSLYIWQELFTNHLPWQGYSYYTNLTITNILLLFVVAYISYNYYEKPFLILKKKFESTVNTHLP